MSLLKADNIRLKEKIEDLETRLVSLVGAFKVFAGGMPGKEHEMNNNIAELITTATELKITAPYITEDYAALLQDRAKHGVKIQIISNERRLWPDKYMSLYDKLKLVPGIDIINNPNVKFLLIWTPNALLYTSSPLCKETLMKTVLIGTLITERSKIAEILKIFQAMLPSFMR